ncbi:hypothetical protein F8388_010554, partial [Cannabis sativa]
FKPIQQQAPTTKPTQESSYPSGFTPVTECSNSSGFKPVTECSNSSGVTPYHIDHKLQSQPLQCGSDNLVFTLENHQGNISATGSIKAPIPIIIDPTKHTTSPTKAIPKHPSQTDSTPASISQTRTTGSHKQAAIKAAPTPPKTTKTGRILPKPKHLNDYHWLEKLNIGRSSGKAKVLGSLVGIGGAMILTLYKGVEINIWSTHVDLLKHGQHQQSHEASPKDEYGNRILGCLLSVGSATSYSLWLIAQDGGGGGVVLDGGGSPGWQRWSWMVAVVMVAKMNQIYPCYYSSSALMSVMGLIQSVVFALCTERDLNQWKLGWNIRLLTVVYSGVTASGLVVILIAWCVKLRGPVFVSVFNPLMLVLVAIAGSFILDEKLHLGWYVYLCLNIFVHQTHYISYNFELYI